MNKKKKIALVLVLFMGGNSFSGVAPTAVWALDTGSARAAIVPKTAVSAPAQPVVAIAPQVKKALDDTTAYLLTTVKAPTVGTMGGEWAVLGLARRGAVVPQNYYEDYYKNVVAYTKAEQAKSSRRWNTKVTETQRVAIALSAIGKNPEAVGGVNLVDFTWNKAKNMSDLSQNDRILGNRQGLNELVFGLITVDLQDSKAPKDATITRDQMLRLIIDTYQTKDGGFSLQKKQALADVDMTAMTLQALAPYYQEKGYEFVTKAVDQALVTLLTIQGTNGSFANSYGNADGSVGATCESTAQVVVALCSLGIDPAKDGRFIKKGRSPIDDLMSYALPTGGFRHLQGGTVDQMATEQAYYALVAYERLTKQQSALYDMK